MKEIYKIKKGIKTPMSLAVLLSLPVFYDVITHGQELRILILASLLMILFYLLTLNNLVRKVTLSPDEITLTALSGTKRIAPAAITSIDGVTMGSRQFVTITAHGRSHLIPNSFERFPNIIKSLGSLIDEQKQGEGLKMIQEHPIERRSDSTGAWITVIILVIVILVRFFPLA